MNCYHLPLKATMIVLRLSFFQKSPECEPVNKCILPSTQHGTVTFPLHTQHIALRIAPQFDKTGGSSDGDHLRGHKTFTPMSTRSQQALESLYLLRTVLPHPVLKNKVWPFLKLTGAEAVATLQRKWRGRRFRKRIERFRLFDRMARCSSSQMFVSEDMVREHLLPLVTLGRGDITIGGVLRFIKEHARPGRTSNIPGRNPEEGGSLYFLKLQSPNHVI